MEYGIEVRVFVRKEQGADIYEWRDMRPTGGKPYRYATRREAENMAYICYGNDPSICRVVEVWAE